MRNEVKAEIDKIASQYITEGGISINSDHNGGSLRIAIDFNGVKKEEADKVDAEVRKKYPHATVYCFVN